MLKNQNIILTDADGVLLNWEYGFHQFIQRYKDVPEDKIVYGTYSISERYDISDRLAMHLVRTYNASAHMLYCKPLRDSVKYVRKLYEEYGYKFHVISSQTDDKYAADLRKQNLCNIFGEDVFDDFTILGCGADKDNALMPYAGSECYWIEDKTKNANLSEVFGLKGILMDHMYNTKDKIADSVIRLPNWKAIYNYITGEIHV